ncbi:MAG: hypothetical protein K8R77_08525 [Anaerolineaceae bacterium]|nr:hypothetical protein [Anaerolineaceae bacterium]
MAQRAIITVQNGSEKHDLNVPLLTTPANIASALGWEEVDSVVVRNRNLTIGGNDPLLGKIREGDLILFNRKESTGWRN